VKEEPPDDPGGTLCLINPGERGGNYTQRLTLGAAHGARRPKALVRSTKPERFQFRVVDGQQTKLRGRQTARQPMTTTKPAKKQPPNRVRKSSPAVNQLAIFSGLLDCTKKNSLQSLLNRLSINLY
jgi:hypothetical protein